MKSLKAPLLLTLGLSATLVLAGCTPTQEEAAPTPSPSETASSTPEATPAEGSSGEIGLDDTATSMKKTDTAPEWAAEVFSSIPAGNWVYVSDDSQVIATTDNFSPDALKTYADGLLTNGWQASVDGEETADSYIKGLINPKTGESITIIGMTKAVPDASGNPDKPASSIVYKK